MEPQPQQINEEIKKQLLGKENEKSKNSSSDTKSKNWMFQSIKEFAYNFAYICLFPFHFLWDLLKIFRSPSREINKQQPVHVITENKSEKVSSSNNQSISDSNTASKTLSTNHSNQLENAVFNAGACNDNDHKINSAQTSVKKAISDSNTASKTLSTNHSNQLENAVFNAGACNDNDHKINSAQTSVKKVKTI